ncbi:MAG: hypothetical protein QF554_00740 [Dehalococcoidia bacterium]|jgi:hypothetical protein|nr:hypothetical protein [Dehalococcoidia bacterium]
MNTRDRVIRRIDQLKWMTLGVTIAIGSLAIPQRPELHQTPGVMLKIHRALPLRSLFTVSMRLPSVFAVN